MGNTTVKHVQYPSGNRYDGEMKRTALDGSKRHGHGTYTWADGTSYVGDWVDNQQHGHGKMSFVNGNMYEGGFYRNNPHGEGVLTTINGERISGLWEFLGRDDQSMQRYHSPVGKYRIRVTVLDQRTQRAQEYFGPAALHLQTGLLVLPGMSDINAPVLVYAVAVVEQSPNVAVPTASAMAVSEAPAVAVPADVGNEKMMTAPPQATVSSAAAPQTAVPLALNPSPVEAVAVPVASNPAPCTAQTAVVPNAVLARPAPASSGAAPQGVAYGMSDPSLQGGAQPDQGRRKPNLLNPALYF